MKQILVKRDFILNSLFANKKRYMNSLEAVLGEWKKLDDVYQEEYRQYSKKVFEQTLTDEDKQPCSPPKPIDRVKDYNFYIDYLGEDMQETQTLTESDYRKLIKDQWDWMRSHVSNLGFYANAITSDSLSADVTGYASGSGSAVMAALRSYNGVLNT